MSHAVDQKANRTLTYILYIFYIVACFTGGVLAIVAVVLNYIKRKDVQGTILESHFKWQIRTFWWYLFWNLSALFLFGFLLWFGHDSLSDSLASGFFGGFLSVIAFSLAWVVYRGINGLLCLYDNVPMYKSVE
ncbi:hypothetical protein QM294_03720 [Acinetobacter junii]|jgi:uncharacterized membrane protein|uniref:DUF4870 family protein n=1 Tax=Acinetobacter junii TaxID=40215 RepID=UPI00195EB1B0|nr:hypothetical protein [Acinetobacter junii]MDI9719957.1 hypothetical protein [Acinetobacter junii]VTX82969.1 Uncharacterised protein [Acinetobacter junii]